MRERTRLCCRRWLRAAGFAVLLLASQMAGASTTRLPSFVRTWGSGGNGNGSFSYPRGIGVDSAGHVYVADRLNNRVQKFASDGTFIAAWGSSGSGNGQFNQPAGVAVDASDNVYVADGENNRIQKLDSSGAFITKWGSSGNGNGELNVPGDVAVDLSGNVFVADTNNHRIQKFDGSGTFITKWGMFGSGDGQFSFPYGLAVDTAGNVYVADNSHHRIQKFDGSGTFITKWGTFGSGEGQLSYPWDVAVDAAGNVYVADHSNNRVQKFSSTGVFRGAWGQAGSGDGEFSSPRGIGVSPLGSIYVSDTYNQRIQQFTLARMVVGLGDGGTGSFEDMATMAPHDLLGWGQVSWPAYNSSNGETRPAFCDVDGDRNDELVLGLGPGGNGWLEIKDDADTGFVHLAWIQIDWAAYNGANGESWPACGDIDGDGRDEIVVGLGSGGKGWAKLFDDSTTGFAAVPATPTAGGWIQVPWSVYNAADGSVHPAVGNLDGDTRDEVVFGLGAGSSGWVHIRDDQMTGFANLAGTPGAGGWMMLGWAAYNGVNGATWPAIGDLDGDGAAELVLGLGSGGAGWLRVFQNAAAGFAPAPGTPATGGWMRIDWSLYNAAVGAGFPAIGDLDGDGAAELIIGLGTYTTSGGWVEIRKSLADGLVHGAWAQVPYPSYNGANGLTRPAVTH